MKKDHELEEEIVARGGVLHVDDDCDDGLRDTFFEYVLAFENAPVTTLRARLAESGVQPPSDLWTLIARLAEMNVVIHSTNHLDDDALHEFLLAELDEPHEFPDFPDVVMHIDVIGAMGEEDIDLWLRYYADDEDREHWRSQFPDAEIPPKMVAPHDRDRFLPEAHRDSVIRN